MYQIAHKYSIYVEMYTNKTVSPTWFTERVPAAERTYRNVV